MKSQIIVMLFIALFIPSGCGGNSATLMVDGTEHKIKHFIEQDGTAFIRIDELAKAIGYKAEEIAQYPSSIFKSYHVGNYSNLQGFQFNTHDIEIIYSRSTGFMVPYDGTVLLVENKKYYVNIDAFAYCGLYHYTYDPAEQRVALESKEDSWKDIFYHQLNDILKGGEEHGYIPEVGFYDSDFDGIPELFSALYTYYEPESKTLISSYHYVGDVYIAQPKGVYVLYYENSYNYAHIYPGSELEDRPDPKSPDEILYISNSDNYKQKINENTKLPFIVLTKELIEELTINS